MTCTSSNTDAVEERVESRRTQTLCHFEHKNDINYCQPDFPILETSVF